MAINFPERSYEEHKRDSAQLRELRAQSSGARKEEPPIGKEKRVRIKRYPGKEQK